jgi:hypothetical protein
MTFLEIRSANLEESRQVPSRNATSILDQIKRSAGNTPAKRLMPQNEDRNVPLRPNDTDGGFAGFGITPHADLAAYSFTTGEFSLFPAASSHTKDESSMLFENNHKLGIYHAKNQTDDRGFLMEKGIVSDSMFHMMDAQRTVSTEETTAFSPMHQSVESRSSDDRSWEACEEPTSLLDNTDGEEEDDEDYTTSGMIGGTDDESYDSDEYDDDETFLSNDESKGPITGVESFLDELAEVEDVNDLGTLLYQVGTCHFAVNVQTADDEFSVDSDAFRAVPLERKEPSRFIAPPRKQSEREEQPAIVSASSSLLEGTTDTIAMILHNMSVTTDSMFEIINSQSMMSESKETMSDKNDSSEVPTPNNANLSFFQSMFGCQG